MREYQRDDRSTLLFVVLIVASFALMTLDLRAAGEGVAGSLRDGVQVVFAPAQRLTDALVRPVTTMVDGVANIAGLREENRRLREELEGLRAQSDELEVLRSENAELRALLALPMPEAALDNQKVDAEVMAVGTSAFDYTITIGKGFEDGLAVDMPVMDERGLIGRVVSVTDTSAKVSLIIDPRNSVAVRAAESRDVGVVAGRGQGPMSLVIFEASSPLEAGARIITAGSDLYPPGILVGTVTTAARPEAGFLLQTAVEPAAAFNRLDYVRVILWASDRVALEEPQEEEPETETDAP